MPAADTVRRTPGGLRLTAALDESLEIPALAEAREHLLRLIESSSPNKSAIVDVLESDLALTASVMRAANTGSARRTVSGIPQAVEEMGLGGIAETATELPTYPLFESQPGRRRLADRISTHATATREAVERIAALAHLPRRDELSMTALLHNVGMFGLAHLNPDNELPDGIDLTGDELEQRERLEFGLDHALIGGVLARRWGLPDRIARGIERHHAKDATGIAAVIRLADMVVNHAQGGTDDREAILKTGGAIDLGPTKLRDLFYGNATGTACRRPSEPNPLSVRELDVLCGLAEGKVYKQIAADLALSASTVRSHLHNAYRKIGAADRAQAVLMARDRGWI
jgi:HD-like signal output (HDOD) protein/DNA-binding CsgD family transcriptional regulator